MNREHVSSAELVDRLGQKPELQQTQDGTPYVQLSIATSERYTDRGGAIRERTEWHRTVAWRTVAQEIATSFDKDDSVALTGSLRINSYEKDGLKHRTTELHVDKAERNPDNKISRNEARLVGIVREDARPQQIESDTPMAVLSVATRTIVNGKEREDWHSMTTWKRTTETACNIKTSDTVAINETLRHRSVPDKDGREKKLSTIECGRFQILERAPERAQKMPKRRSKDVQQSM